MAKLLYRFIEWLIFEFPLGQYEEFNLPETVEIYRRWGPIRAWCSLIQVWAEDKAGIQVGPLEITATLDGEEWIKPGLSLTWV